MEAKTRRIEIFSAGCRGCEETIALVRKVACRSCDVQVVDVRQVDAYNRAKKYGIRKFPAVVVDGKLAECCAQNAVNEDVLKRMGLGVAL